MKRVMRLLSVIILSTAVLFSLGCASDASGDGSLIVPDLDVTIVADGLDHPWGLAVLPDGAILFTERSGRLSVIPAESGEAKEIAFFDEVRAGGEGGLLGLAVDSEFEDNRFIYLAGNTGVDAPRVHVWRFVLNEHYEISERRSIVDDIPASPSGRHSGTQLAMDKDGVLWIGTGDAADGGNPQDPASLGGKILRIDRDGQPAEGNLEPPFDPRVFSYGHRNTQGLVLFAEEADGSIGYSAEHGSWIEDEVNPLIPGNFGWAPGLPYDENVPMTDNTRFPDAIEAVWNSGDSTIAVSGVTVLAGEHWGELEGVVVLGTLKGRHLLLLRIEDGRVIQSAKQFAGEFGRIRAVHLGSDGALYLSTDNGQTDAIFRIRPDEAEH